MVGNKLYINYFLFIELLQNKKETKEKWIAIDPNHKNFFTMEKKDPSIREFKCPNCNTKLNRDINSGVNIAKKDSLLSGSDHLYGIYLILNVLLGGILENLKYPSLIYSYSIYICR